MVGEVGELPAAVEDFVTEVAAVFPRALRKADGVKKRSSLWGDLIPAKGDPCACGLLVSLEMCFYGLRLLNTHSGALGLQRLAREQACTNHASHGEQSLVDICLDHALGDLTEQRLKGDRHTFRSGAITLTSPLVPLRGGRDRP